MGKGLCPTAMLLFATYGVVQESTMRLPD